MPTWGSLTAGLPKGHLLMHSMAVLQVYQENIFTVRELPGHCPNRLPPGRGLQPSIICQTSAVLCMVHLLYRSA